MGFEPFSDEHAIQRVGFGCILSEPLDIAALRRVRSRRSEIQTDLPAVTFSEGGEPELQFGYLRPNGSPTWALKLSDNAIYVENSRYTRWDRVWSQAKRFIEFAANALPEDTYRIVSFGLRVTDRFRSPVESYNLNELFIENILLPQNIFRRGHAWRYEYGWTELTNDGEASSNLEVFTQSSERLDKKDGTTKPFVSILVDHTQECTPPQLLKIADAMDSGLNYFMKEMHQRNKLCIDSILTEKMKKKINLWGEA